MISYTTPQISRREFDDWNPSKRLDTVADTAAYIKRQYGVENVYLLETPDGIHFQVVGSPSAVAKFAALYGD